MTDSRSQFDPLEALTVEQVRKLLHVSRPTVVKHMKSGELPSVLIGRCRRVRRVDLEDFLQIHRTREWRSYRPEAARLEGHRHEADDFPDEGDVIPF